MEVVERRRCSSASVTPGLRRSRSVRSSLKLVGTRWRKATENAASNVPCSPSNQEANQQSAVKFQRASALLTQHRPSLGLPSQQHKQKSLRASWLPVFSNQLNKLVKSSSASVGKEKQHKLSKATWIFGLATQQNKQYKNKSASNQSSENKETVEDRPSKATWILGLTKEQTKSSSLQILTEQHKHLKISSQLLSTETSSSPQRTYMQHKSNSLSRCSPLPKEQFLQQQQQFLPVVSSVGTKRRNSMWALSSSKSSMLRFI
jgi:hypothetical protein